MQTAPTTQPTTPTTQPTTPTTQPTTPTTQPTTPTTQPTTPPATPTPMLLPSECGGGPGVLTGPTGFIQTVDWPSSPYPAVADCLWEITCPPGQRVDINFKDSFRISGKMPSCTKDTLQIFDCDGSIEYGPFCHLTRPNAFTSSCNKIDVVFKAKNMRGVTRTGFRLDYECIQVDEPKTAPTTQPTTPTTQPTTPTTQPTTPTTQPTTPTTQPTTPTTQPTTPTTQPTTPTTQPTTPTTQPTTPPPTPLPTECGGGPGGLSDTSGSIQTVGWPDTPYPLMADCSWNINCPAGTNIEISFDSSFRISGRMPSCDKDQVIVTECDGAKVHGPFCHLTPPETITTACNKANVSFLSKGIRGRTRTGFRLNYRCVEA